MSVFFNSILSSNSQAPPRLMDWFLSEEMADDGDNKVERDDGVEGDGEVGEVVEVLTGDVAEPH